MVGLLNTVKNFEVTQKAVVSSKRTATRNYLLKAIPPQFRSCADAQSNCRRLRTVRVFMYNLN